MREQLYIYCIRCDYVLPLTAEGLVLFGETTWGQSYYKQKLHRCSEYQGGKAVGMGEFIVTSIPWAHGTPAR